MATATFSGQEITIGTAETEYQFSDIPTDYDKEIVIQITCNSTNAGTIQFSVGRAIASDHRASVASEKRLMTIKNGLLNFRAKASQSGQKFTVDY